MGCYEDVSELLYEEPAPVEFRIYRGRARTLRATARGHARVIA